MVLPSLRIAILSAHSCPVGTLGARDTGGMSVYIRELARELGRQGHTADVYTRVHNSADPQIESLGENARLIHLKAGPEGEMHKLVLYPHLPDFACRLENFRKDRGLRYDIVFSHYWLSGLAGEYLQMWWQVPHIIMFHTLGAVKNAIGIGEDEPELRLFTEGELTGSCHRIIAATGRERGELIRRYGALPGKISVIPCGVNLELFRPEDRGTARQKLGLSGEKIILVVSRIEPMKGIERLLKALPYLPDMPGLRLVIIGGDAYSQPEVSRLQSLACDRHVPVAVTFLGAVKHEQLPYYYSAADVCVIPSYYESFSLVALESLACGTPVVAADVGDLRNIIRQGETGYVVDAGAPARLAEKMGLILSRPSPVDPATIRASVRRFGWPGVAENIIGEMRRVLADKLAPVA